MKLQIIGDGSFGTFLKELLAPHFQICNDADSVILAVPMSAYDEVASKNKSKHLINVCSVQKPSTDICLKHSDRVTSVHPLFGRRTPAEKRNCILTYSFNSHMVDTDTWWSPPVNVESEFLKILGIVSVVWQNFTPESHDILMAKTHASAVMGAQQLKVLVDRVKDVPDHLLPNSFRLMRQFVQTLEDMPQGTIDSIMANPYI